MEFELMPAAVAVKRNADLPLEQPRLLYAEDQASSRVVTAALLRKLGYHVDAVEDGELALQMAMGKSYDAILLDIEMPVMDGMTAARRIRSEAPLCHQTPILALSAYLADSTEMNNWRNLFDHALPKPASGAQLQKAIKQALGAEPYADREVERASHGLATHTVTFVAFREVLPKSMWIRLFERAVEDTHTLALTVCALAEAGDQEELQQSLQALLKLAKSFDAIDVADCAERIAMFPSPENSAALMAAVATWSLQSGN